MDVCSCHLKEQVVVLKVFVKGKIEKFHFLGNDKCLMIEKNIEIFPERAVIAN